MIIVAQCLTTRILKVLAASNFFSAYSCVIPVTNPLVRSHCLGASLFYQFAFLQGYRLTPFSCFSSWIY